MANKLKELTTFANLESAWLIYLEQALRNIITTKWHPSLSPQDIQRLNLFLELAKPHSMASGVGLQEAANKIGGFIRCFNVRRLSRLDYYRNGALSVKAREYCLKKFLDFCNNLMG